MRKGQASASWPPPGVCTWSTWDLAGRVALGPACGQANRTLWYVGLSQPFQALLSPGTVLAPHRVGTGLVSTGGQGV